MIGSLAAAKAAGAVALAAAAGAAVLGVMWMQASHRAEVAGMRAAAIAQQRDGLQAEVERLQGIRKSDEDRERDYAAIVTQARTAVAGLEQRASALVDSMGRARAAGLRDRGAPAGPAVVPPIPGTPGGTSGEAAGSGLRPPVAGPDRPVTLADLDTACARAARVATEATVDYNALLDAWAASRARYYQALQPIDRKDR